MPIPNQTLRDAQLIRLIRVLEDHRRVASFWYLHRSNQNMVNAALSRVGLDLNELQAIAERLPTVRDRTFVHIDKNDVFDPQKLYKDAGIAVGRVARVSVQLWEAMQEVHRLTHGSEFQADDYKGADIPMLAKLRDDVESGKILAS